ncbi:MAG: hypothetical protein RLZ12_540, partial [Bacillota bacterium]
MVLPMDQLPPDLEGAVDSFTTQVAHKILSWADLSLELNFIQTLANNLCNLPLTDFYDQTIKATIERLANVIETIAEFKIQPEKKDKVSAENIQDLAKVTSQVLAILIILHDALQNSLNCSASPFYLTISHNIKAKLFENPVIKKWINESFPLFNDLEPHLTNILIMPNAPNQQDLRPKSTHVHFPETAPELLQSFEIPARAARERAAALKASAEFLKIIKDEIISNGKQATPDTQQKINKLLTFFLAILACDPDIQTLPIVCETEPLEAQEKIPLWDKLLVQINELISFLTRNKIKHEELMNFNLNYKPLIETTIKNLITNKPTETNALALRLSSFIKNGEQYLTNSLSLPSSGLPLPPSSGLPLPPPPQEKYNRSVLPILANTGVPLAPAPILTTSAMHHIGILPYAWPLPSTSILSETIINPPMTKSIEEKGLNIVRKRHHFRVSPYSRAMTPPKIKGEELTLDLLENILNYIDSLPESYPHSSIPHDIQDSLLEVLRKLTPLTEQTLFKLFSEKLLYLITIYNVLATNNTIFDRQIIKQIEVLCKILQNFFATSVLHKLQLNNCFQTPSSGLPLPPPPSSGLPLPPPPNSGLPLPPPPSSGLPLPLPPSSGLPLPPPPSSGLPLPPPPNSGLPLP